MIVSIITLERYSHTFRLILSSCVAASTELQRRRADDRQPDLLRRAAKERSVRPGSFPSQVGGSDPSTCIPVTDVIVVCWIQAGLFPHAAPPLLPPRRRSSRCLRGRPLRSPLPSLQGCWPTRLLWTCRDRSRSRIRPRW